MVLKVGEVDGCFCEGDFGKIFYFIFLWQFIGFCQVYCIFWQFFLLVVIEFWVGEDQEIGYVYFGGWCLCQLFKNLVGFGILVIGSMDWCYGIGELNGGGYSGGCGIGQILCVNGDCVVCFL